MKALLHISGMGSRTGHTTQTKGKMPGKGRQKASTPSNANVVALVKYLARYAAERDDAASRKKRSCSHRLNGANKDSHKGDTK